MASSNQARRPRPGGIHSNSARFVISFGAVVVATLIGSMLHRVLGGAVPFILYYPAVLVAAWYGGFASGIFATILSSIAADLFFIGEPYTFTPLNTPLGVALLVFVASSVFTSFLAELRLRALNRETDLRLQESELKEQLDREKKSIEEILASFDDALCVVDGEWRVVYANEPVAKLAGVRKESLTGCKLWDAFLDQEAIDRPQLENAMKERKPIRFQTQNRKTGAWLSIGAYPCDANGLTIFAMDVSARKKLEDDLRTAQQQLKQHAATLETEVQKRTAELRESIAELESFSYTVSHDLRSPLRAMQAFAFMTLDEEGENLTPQGRDYLQKIDAAAKRMDALIQNVITYNKVARSEIRLETVDTGQIVDEVIHQYPSVNKPHARFHIEKPLDPVFANPAALVQAISNVLSNAVKFVPPGHEASVKISTHKTDSKVSLCVEDHGIGIPPEVLPKIFEPFHRGHSTSEYEGTGIGLAVAKKAIERMGGKIDVQSEIGKGTTFCIQLQTPP